MPYALPAPIRSQALNALAGPCLPALTALASPSPCEQPILMCATPSLISTRQRALSNFANRERAPQRPHGVHVCVHADPPTHPSSAHADTRVRVA